MFGVDAARLITPEALITRPAGNAENVPPVAPVVVSVVVPVAQKVPPLTVAVGRHAFHVTVVEAVAVLPQASIAVNVLVLEAEHDVVDIAPSLDVTDAVLQPSEAVAVPRAAVICRSRWITTKCCNSTGNSDHRWILISHPCYGS